MKFYHFSPISNLSDLQPSNPKDCDLYGVYLTKSLEDSWYWVKRMLNEGYFIDNKIYVYEVNLEPTQVFHPRYKGCKIAWVRWNGLEDSSTSNNGHFNNYQQFVFPSSVKCEQIL